MNHTSSEKSYEGKISTKDTSGQVVNIQLYAQYDARDALEEYHFRYSVEGKKLTTNSSAKGLEELAWIISSEVVIVDKIRNPQYDIQLVDGPLPKEKVSQGYVSYTAKPSDDVKRDLISLIMERRDELIDQMCEDHLKQEQTHKKFVKGRPIVPRCRRF